MTGYAALDRDGRRWELRSVNARGLDLRMRLPDRPAGLEPAARARLSAAVARGNVTLSLRLGRDGAATEASLIPDALDRVLTALSEVRAAAVAADLEPRAASTAEILALRGVWDVRDAADDLDLATCDAELDALIAAFLADRAREGAALSEMLTAHVDEIARLACAARGLVAARSDHLADGFRAALGRLQRQEGDAVVPEDRVAAEIAVLAVRGDVAEELDRLDAHVAAARELLATDAPVGRRLDFLTQELNREANTLCAKSQMSEMTAIGLDLKVTIDRLREQVQNVE